MPLDRNQLKARVKRVLSKTTMELIGNGFRSIVGPLREGDAKRAVEKLENGAEPTAQELVALEMLVRTMRPAPLCKAGVVGDLPADNGAFPLWEDFRNAVRPYLNSIGRIDAVRPEELGSANPADNPVGTGFLISESVLVTNAHVLNILSTGTFTLSPGQVVVWFKREYDAPDEPLVPVQKVIGYDRALDIALLRLAPHTPANDGRQPLVLDDSDAPLSLGSSIAAIGYPSDDVARNPLFVPQIFGGRFNVKRVAPGEITDAHDGIFFHDCSTLGGNSGSPLLSLQTAKVVGLHRAGVFLTSNEAVNALALVDFARKSNPGGN